MKATRFIGIFMLCWLWLACFLSLYRDIGVEAFYLTGLVIITTLYIILAIYLILK